MDSRNGFGFGFEKPEFGFSKFAKEKMGNSSQRPDSVPPQDDIDFRIPFARGNMEALKASMRRKKSWAIIVVKGYENPFPETDETKKALLDHLSSCGKIQIRRFDFADDPFNLLTERCALIEVWGKKGVAKAVELSGSEMEGGQKIVVRPALTFKEMCENQPFGFQCFGSPVPNT